MLSFLHNQNFIFGKEMYHIIYVIVIVIAMNYKYEDMYHSMYPQPNFRKCLKMSSCDILFYDIS